MSAWNRWLRRLVAVLGAVVLWMLVPVAAWASTGTGDRMVEAQRGARGGGGGFCCLVVIAVVVLLVWLIRRRRGRPR